MAQDAESRRPPATEDRARPPGPDGWPLVGNTFQLAGDPFAFYERCRETYDSDVVTYRVLNERAYMLTHPEDIRTVLVERASDFTKGRAIAESLGQITPSGLVVTDGEEWRRDRKLLQPAFQRDRVASHAPTIARYTADAAADWTPGESLEINAALRDLTLNVLAKTLLDVDVRGRSTAIGRASDVVTDRFDSGTLSAWLPLWLPTPANLRAKRAIGDFQDVVDDIISERRASADANTDDLLGLLLHGTYDDGTSPGEDRIRDQLLTFLFAGHETTALALTYALFRLANDQDRQDRLREQLADLPSDPEDADADVLGRVPYLEAVIQETLRLYPPAFVVLREPQVDIELGGYEIPAGSVVSLPQWNVHRDPRWWDEPDEFRPERWLEADEDGEGAGAVEEDDDRPEYAYFPFGGGPRACIGMRFARLEAGLVLATLLREFRFEAVTEPPLDLSMQITLQPDEPVHVIPRAIDGD